MRAGNIIHQQRYSPYGATLRSVAALDRYLGRERDARDRAHPARRAVLCARVRPVHLRRLVRAGKSEANRRGMPQGYNLYSYGLNNPLAFRDPSGMFIFALIAAIAIVAGRRFDRRLRGRVSFRGWFTGSSNGQGWGSLLTALEAGLTTTAGMWLGAIAGGAPGSSIGGPAGMVVGAVIGGVMGGMNGLISGVHGIYDWASIDGWFAFFSDSTWSLLGTSLGNVVHIINLFYSDSNYRHDLSHRQNRHVYEGGFALKSDFAFTSGQRDQQRRPGRERNQRRVHRQPRGAAHLAAAVLRPDLPGHLRGLGRRRIHRRESSIGCSTRDEDWGSLVETAAYYDNPFEYWAYNNDTNWPPAG